MKKTQNRKIMAALKDLDAGMTHVYLNNLSDDAVDYLYNLAHRLPAEQLQSYMVHWNGNTENILGFFEVR